MGCAASSNKPSTNCVLHWNSKYKTQKYHWWPMKNSNIEKEDPINNLFAKGGGLEKYDKIFNTNALEYQKENYCIFPDSVRRDKNWAGFCDRAAMLSCLYKYPIKPVTVFHNNIKVIFSSRDIEALMIVVSNSTVCKSLSVFYGSRNNSKSNTSKLKQEPYPLELLEILTRFSKEDECFVIDVDNGSAVWNYPFDSLCVTIEPIEFSDERIPKTGRNVVYRFIIESTAYPKKNIDILGLVNYQDDYVHQTWLSDNNPDFLWKNYRKQGHWKGKSDMNPHIKSEIVYEIYKSSIVGNGILKL